MKKTKTLLCRLLAFLVLFAVLLVYVTGMLESKGSTVAGFYDEAKNSVDVVYLGGSHANAAFDPMTLYHDYGYTGYVMYSWAQPMWTSYYYLEEALKTQAPKVVVLDAFGMAYGNTYISTNDTDATSDDFSLLIRPSFTRAKLAFAMSAAQAEHKSVTRYLSYINYHNRWKTLTAQDWLWPFAKAHAAGKGYGPIYTTESHAPQYAVAEPAAATIYPPCMEYLNKIKALCDQNGASLVLTVAPYIVASDAEYDLYRQVGSWCEQNNVAYLNYLEDAPAERIGFDYGADLGDHGHVNWRGAAKITADVGSYLAANFALPDHRGDAAYAQWDSDLAAQQRDAQNMELKLQAELGGLLDAAFADNYVTVVAVRGNLAGTAPYTVTDTMKAHQMSPELFSETNAAALYVFVGGEKVYADDTGAGSRQYQEGALAFTAACTPEAAAVTQNGENICRDQAGINVVVFDRTTGERIQSIAFLAGQGYASYTG
ncbi:MAG: hypothetical protein LKJ90_07150 [Faecalibacterium sp.]|jgi:hypothetical protein|nr:hypothetical protein [Faecalibacterium sp.]